MTREEFISHVLREVDLEGLMAVHGHNRVALRVQEKPYDLSPGDVVAHRSHVWENGEETETELPGVCAVSARSATPRILAQYPGNCLIILVGDVVAYGEDVGEVIMDCPSVWAVYFPEEGWENY